MSIVSAARRHRLLLLPATVCALALTAGRAWAGIGRWTPFGPGGGFINQILIEPAADPAADGTLYAATDAGVFASSNGGVTWRACGPESSDTSQGFYRRVFLVPDQPGVLLTSRRGFIYRSTDSCMHWTLLSQETDLIAVVRGAPGAPPVLYAEGAGAPLLRSRNSGATWDEITVDARPDAGELMLLAANPETPERLYAALRSAGTGLTTIYRSDDTGDSWQPLPAAPEGYLTCLAAAPSRPSVLYTITDSTLYRSADAGTTWTAKGQVLAACVQVSPLSPDVLWAVGFYTLSASRDGGKTWNAIDSGLPAPHGDYSDAYKVLSLAVDARRPGALWAGTRGSGVRRSSDGGRTWSTPGLQRGLTSLPVTGLFADPGDPGRLYMTLPGSWDAATPPSVLRSRNGGRTWEAYGSELSTPQGPLATLAFDRHDPLSLWAVAGATLSHSTDRGKTWESIGGIPQERLTVLDAKTFLSDGWGVSRSTDGGQTWTEVLPVDVSPDDPNGPTRISLELMVDPWQPAILYDRVEEEGHAWGNQRVYKSRDGGATWHRMIDNSNVLAVDPKHAGRLFTVKNGAVLRSLDRGVTWSAVGRLDGWVRALRMDFQATGVLYAATDHGLSWSRDAGATWQDVPAGLATIGRNNLVDIVVDPFRSFHLYGLPTGGGLYEIDLRPSGAP